jgi:hypothetical protein
MKSLLLSSLLFSLALGGVVPKAEGKVDYHGFKVLRLALKGAAKELDAQIEELAAHVLNPGKGAHVDVVVSPENLDAISALGVASTVVNEDVGAALDEEGGMSAYAGTCNELLPGQSLTRLQSQVRLGLPHTIPTRTTSNS